MKTTYFFLFSMLLLMENSHGIPLKKPGARIDCNYGPMNCNTQSTYPYCVSANGTVTKGPCKGNEKTYHNAQCCTQDISCFDGSSETDVYVFPAYPGPGINQDYELYNDSAMPPETIGCPTLEQYLAQQPKKKKQR